jgi:hypothetical protein
MPHACHSEPFASLRVNAARNLSGSRTTPRAAQGDHAGYSQVIAWRIDDAWCEWQRFERDLLSGSRHVIASFVLVDDYSLFGSDRREG